MSREDIESHQDLARGTTKARPKTSWVSKRRMLLNKQKFYDIANKLDVRSSSSVARGMAHGARGTGRWCNKGNKKMRKTTEKRKHNYNKWQRAKPPKPFVLLSVLTNNVGHNMYTQPAPYPVVLAPLHVLPLTRTNIWQLPQTQKAGRTKKKWRQRSTTFGWFHKRSNRAAKKKKNNRKQNAHSCNNKSQAARPAHGDGQKTTKKKWILKKC